MKLLLFVVLAVALATASAQAPHGDQKVMARCAKRCRLDCAEHRACIMRNCPACSDPKCVFTKMRDGECSRESCPADSDCTGCINRCAGSDFIKNLQEKRACMRTCRAEGLKTKEQCRADCRAAHPKSSA